MSVLHMVIWYQVFSSNTSNLQTDLIWLIDRSLTGTTTLGKSKPESNGNEGVLYIPQNTKTGCNLMSYFRYLFLLGEGLIFLQEIQCILSPANKAVNSFVFNF